MSAVVGDYTEYVLDRYDYLAFGVGVNALNTVTSGGTVEPGFIKRGGMF